MKIVKKILSCFLIIVMLLTVMPISSAELTFTNKAAALEREIIDSGVTTEHITWTLYSDGELVISGHGNMPSSKNIPSDANSADIYWLKHKEKITSVTIEEGITSVDLLMGLYNVTTVSFPEGLISIEPMACMYMYSLKELILPSTLKSIGLYAFNCCVSLEKVNLPEGLENMSGSFAYCLSLKELIVPGSVKAFTPYAVYGCVSLEKLVLSEGTVLTICDDNLNGLTPEEMGFSKEIADAAIQSESNDVFGELINLEYLEIPSSVTNEIVFNVSSPFLKEVRNYSEFLTIVPPETSITNERNETLQTFMANCPKVALLSSFLSETEGFQNFDVDTVTKNVCGLSLAEIGDVMSDNFPSYEDLIKAYACLSEKDINSASEMFYYMQSGAIADIPLGTNNTVIYCYDNSAQHDFIRSQAQMSFSRHILLDNNEECANELILKKTYEANDIHGEFSYEIDVESGTLILSGNGKMPVWSGTDIPGYAPCKYLFNKIVFEEGSNITDVSSLAFAGINDTVVYIPSSVQSVSEQAFAYASGITVYFAKGCNFEPDFVNPSANFKEFIVEEGHQRYFSYDGALYSYEASEMIGNNGYSGITLRKVPQEKTSIEIADTTKAIDPASFMYCLVETVSFPDSVVFAPGLIFQGCPNLKNIYIGQNCSSVLPVSYIAPVEKITVDSNNKYLSSDENGVLYLNAVRDGNFGYPHSLLQYPAGNKAKSYTIPDEVYTVYAQAFAFNEQLEEVIIPEQVIKVGEDAFVNAFSLKKITFLNPETDIDTCETTIPEQVVIYGYSGSTAEEYAIKHGRIFIEISGCVHRGGTATCESKAICELCGEEYGSLGEHIEVTYKQDETCTVNGYILYFCEVCGEDLDLEVIPAAHLWGDYSESIAATCTQKGEEKRICQRCSEEDTRETPVLQHDFSDEWTVDKEATCIEEGSQSRHCNNCSATTDVCEIEKAEHTFEDWYVVSEPTFISEGLEERKCEVCKISEPRAIPMLETKEYTDEKSGISISANEESYGGKDFEVHVEEVFDGSQYLGQSFGKTETWNIKTYINGESVQPEAPVYVKIPLPEDFNEKKVFVYHIDSQTGEREKMDSEVIDGYVCFYTSSFSLYIIVDESTLIDESCDHFCHKSGFMGFIWKIVRFFYKLFNLNPVCSCGEMHY